MWIWQQADWPHFFWDKKVIEPKLRDIRFHQGINTSQYHKVAKVSKPTASRHLAALVELGCLVKSEAGGRSTRYKLSNHYRPS